jgi:hypothetical protein
MIGYMATWHKVIPSSENHSNTGPIAINRRRTFEKMAPRWGP